MAQPSDVAGSGRLEVRRVAGRSAVVSAIARAPLVLRTPRVRGEAAWAFVGSLGGGLVHGDALALSLEVARDATAVVATQASTKVYRGARGLTQEASARVEDGGLLVWRPDPLACFAGARYAQAMHVRLEGDGSLLLEDTLTCGRRASGERWDFTRYRSRIVVERDGRAVLADALLLDAAHGSVAARMGRWDVIATVVAFGPRVAAAANAMLATHGSRAGGAVVAASALRGGGAIARVVAESVEASQRITRALTGAPPG